MSLGDFLFPNVELKLVIVRSFKTDIEAARGIPSDKYTSETAVVRLHHGDMQKLSLKERSTVNLKSPSGSVVVRAIANDKTPEGYAIMPQGPWSLALVAIPEGASTPTIHGISVTATRSTEDITSVETLFDL
jgi:formylmethanofuran dehydrogenase subunit D